jgi:hypothetical protein
MRKLSASFIFSISLIAALPGQGFNIPTREWGLSFGNSTSFNGIRFNLVDKDIERINGINISAWGHKESERQTGTVNGISIGLPAAIGTENRQGLNIGILGSGAKNNIKGINLGLLGTGAGNDAVGINFGLLGAGAGNNCVGLNIGGLGVGAGGNMTGINLGGLGAGAGGDVKGISMGILGAGAGGDMIGINFGGLGCGAGGTLGGINFGGLGCGAGGDVWGLNVGGLGVGGGGSVTGINLSVLAVGSGEHLKGISIAGLGAGAPAVTGLQVALVSGGNTVRGITLAPAYFRIEGDDEAYMKGLSVSVFNHISGDQFGIAIGIFNYAWSVRGFQLGVLNHIKNNPPGLRWLPVFNTNFGST